MQHIINELFNKNKIGFLYCLIDAFTMAMVKTILSDVKESN